MATTVIKQRFSRGLSNIIFRFLMKHKTEYRQNTLESSSQTSSGVTAWLSMAGRSSPVSELQTASGRLCRDPGGGQGRVIHRTGHMEIILQQNHQKMVKLPRCAQSPCTGISYPPFFLVYLIHKIPLELQIQAQTQAQFRETNLVNSF